MWEFLRPFIDQQGEIRDGSSMQIGHRPILALVSYFDQYDSILSSRLKLIRIVFRKGRDAALPPKLQSIPALKWRY